MLLDVWESEINGFDGMVKSFQKTEFCYDVSFGTIYIELVAVWERGGCWCCCQRGGHDVISGSNRVEVLLNGHWCESCCDLQLSWVTANGQALCYYYICLERKCRSSAPSLSGWLTSIPAVSMLDDTTVRKGVSANQGHPPSSAIA